MAGRKHAFEFFVIVHVIVAGQHIDFTQHAVPFIPKVRQHVWPHVGFISDIIIGC